MTASDAKIYKQLALVPTDLLVPICFKQCLETLSRKHKAYTIFQSQLYKDIFRKIVLARFL